MTDMQTVQAEAGGALAAFAAEAVAAELTLDQRRQVIDQALLLIDELYVHLPLKRAMHAVDPVQRLKLLRQRVDTLSDPQFHGEMLSIFISLRDLHTSYTLPAPYRRRDAFLPFRIERYYEAGVERYVLTRVAPDFVDPEFKPGVDVTHWNGIPIARAVELNGERNGGSNMPARLARGLESLTFRPMARLAPPDEQWVDIGYVGLDGKPREFRQPWLVRERVVSPQAATPDSADADVVGGLGIDALVEAIRRVQKAVLAPDKIELEQKMAAAAEAPPDADLGLVSTLPDVLEFRPVTTKDGEFGYLRIRTFMVGKTGADILAFVEEVERILGLLPKTGLIVDVRGNGGGIILAGELLLQLFTPRRIDPSRLSFINTPLTLRAAAATDWLNAWQPSIHEAVETGATFSDGFAVIPDHEVYNLVGQRYHGPVALITDALCYSTTDIFAAGFQDHTIGPIVGVDRNTGAGGANVWEHAFMVTDVKGLTPELKPLPKDTGMTVAIRRTTRVGDRQGDPLEDLGVVPGVVHEMTKKDVLGTNEDLITKVGEILAGMPVYVLDAETVPEGGVTTATVTTKNLDRLDVYVDDRPLESHDVSDGAHTVRLPSNGASARRVDLRGYAGGELVAARRLEV